MNLKLLISRFQMLSEERVERKVKKVKNLRNLRMFLGSQN